MQFSILLTTLFSLAITAMADIHDGKPVCAPNEARLCCSCGGCNANGNCPAGSPDAGCPCIKADPRLGNVCDGQPPFEGVQC
ncbi:Ecp18 [Fulvia fulva]|uniref:Ecp18 n=1 Tax=Passalora fulva TaxID=5499 RepID=A0A1P8YXG9_PASFU|nr:Ecp18 [Fulvia fulva]AQA29206.1 extracellular protein 18 [Fulvia fulva]KAK4619410.1 Ecp18 [Fulvia fulva]KAK4620826.1 Ecp18 [Fulvia fulva]UJO19795.1 Ecp18 [Fulvia fulva]WPV17066.1 Ecp18 [Fulvia fulva]